ncbi:DNA mismatch repair protein MutS2 [Reichenbachiella agariperforans]|uniref:Endonuclease MutS2 n=1 Tax=Reichenbachiella agariperforans TaxID=156994 RepID=A0A1M6VL60_REIAG|nr:endonuclease MutS2 [Reichenbachiella agariperforans]SHK82232.1 DNA mismatch repair protein MutS2 [Reichenbachiella agariperforans]
MNLYPKEIEVKLSFDKVKEIISDNCLGPLGQDFVDRLVFSTRVDKINEWLGQTREFMSILTSGGGFPAAAYTDIFPYLKQAQVPGSFLDEEQLHEIKAVVDTLGKVHLFFTTHETEYPVLFDRLGAIAVDALLLHALESKIDEKGQLRDDASKELMRIRSAISKSQVRARTAVNKILKQADQHGYTPDGASLTVRDGRLVIPVLAEHKRHVRGFVHDESATGQTVYLEPAEALEINNELRELKYAERREIIRILTELTDMVRMHQGDIERGLRMLGVLDFIQAKARFAITFECICPVVEKTQKIAWKQARHPILEHALHEQGREIKALDIVLSPSERILLVSGPNAGGKSVCLKTIGLIQYMVQCGVPVAVDEESKFGMFSSIFMDIGDEQSIENDLSTYSSHLTNMKFFLEHTDSKTLFLIDEFGTGTEPQFGGAIAEVVLYELAKSKAYGAITTHYGNLKKMADQVNGIVNAAMKYDVKKLEPLYELEIGKPGSSFALEIAGKIGLDPKMLERAKKKAGVSHVQFDRMLSELEAEKNNLDKQKKEIEAKNKRLSDSIKDYQDLKKFLDKKKDEVLKDAKREAARVIESSNKRVESTIKQIQEAKADKKRVQLAREQLHTHRDQLAKEAVTKVAKPLSAKEQKIEVGDKVKMVSSGAAGEVVAIKGNQVELTLGGLTSRVKLKDLEKISSKQFKQTTDDRVKQMTGIDLNFKMANFNMTLDIRGVRAEEAIGKVEDYIDEALLLGHPEVKILHGKGHGILRDLVRNVLRENRKVIKTADEHVERGGMGITVVTLED